MLRYSKEVCPVSVTIATDASLAGYGGHWGAKFITGEFPANWGFLNIEALEMYAVLALLGTFAEHFNFSKIE